LFRVVLCISLLAAASLVGATTSVAKTTAHGPYPIVYAPFKLEPASAGAKVRVFDTFFTNRSSRDRSVNLNVEFGTDPAKRALWAKLGNTKLKPNPTNVLYYTVVTIPAGHTVTVKVAYSTASYAKGICFGVSSWVMDDNSDNRQPARAQCFNFKK